MNCLNMHHPVSSLAPVCLKLLATHPAEPGIWHDLRIAGGAIVPMSGRRGCSRAPLAVATDRWQLSGMSSWAQPDILDDDDFWKLRMLVFAAMSLKAAAKNRRTASGFRQALLPWFIDLPGQILPSQFKWVCISPLPCRILQGKHLPGNRSLSFQTWRHLPSCKQNGSCCRGTLSETCMCIFTKLWDCLGIRTVYNGVTYFKNQWDHI